MKETHKCFNHYSQNTLYTPNFIPSPINQRIQLVIPKMLPLSFLHITQVKKKMFKFIFSEFSLFFYVTCVSLSQTMQIRLSLSLLLLSLLYNYRS